jgi:hypothetical protein
MIVPINPQIVEDACHARNAPMTGFTTGFKTAFMLLVASATLMTAAWLSPPAQAAEDGLNACGCRQGASQGMCYCEKKSHCGCPGECEPQGCEERRAKQMEKEIQAETRKAEESARRQRPRESDESSGERDDDRGRGAGAQNARPPEPPARKVRVVKMTPAQKRDLGRLIGAYLAEHPDQGNRPLDEVRSEVNRR